MLRRHSILVEQAGATRRKEVERLQKEVGTDMS